MRERHAAQLGVSVESLTTLGVVWSQSHGGWLWPMRNDAGTMTGMRVRTVDGDKWAVKGSTAGIFLPSLTPQARVYAVEGGTDCAALLTLGLYAVGRHACLGQEEMLARFLVRVGAKECVIVADNDEPQHAVTCPQRDDEAAACNCTPRYPGYDGAEKLLAALTVPACIITPPAKDVREAVRNGLTAAMVAGLVRSTRFTGGRK
jgi:phage/plasmid primase-like uncharacterized protein